MGRRTFKTIRAEVAENTSRWFSGRVSSPLPSFDVWTTRPATNAETVIPGGGLDLLEKKKKHTSSRVEEEVDARNCLRGKAKENRTHLATECEPYSEE